MNKNILLYQDDYMLSDPIGYNELVLSFFREKYNNYIQEIFNRIRKESISQEHPWLKSLLSIVQYKNIERHLFPIFAAANCSGGISPYHLDLAVAFVKSTSLPVLAIDTMIDSQEKSPFLYNSSNLPSNILALVKLSSVYDGLSDLTYLPNSSKIITIFIHNYQQIYSALYNDIYQRFNINGIEYPKMALRAHFNTQSPLLTCKYFSTTIQSSILINKIEITPDIISIAESFGRIRQLCDQISDIDEDISAGIISIPILFSLLQDKSTLPSIIKDLWSGKSKSDIKIKETVEKYGGLTRSYRLADAWYKQAIKLISEASRVLGNHSEIELLFRLKRAYLERLKCNNWNDIPGYY